MKKRSRIQTQIADRKAKRKEERQSKKRKRLPSHNNTNTAVLSSSATSNSSNNAPNEQQKQNPFNQNNVNINHKNNQLTPSQEKKQDKKKSKISSKQKTKKNKLLDMVDEATAAAIRKDDEEIAFLEKNLGLHKGNSKDKKKLHREYAKLEGYGDDFGDFLDGLDGILENIAGGDHVDDDSYEHDSLDDMMMVGHYRDSEEESLDDEASRAKKLLRKDVSFENDDDSDVDEELVPMKGGEEYYDDDYENSDEEDKYSLAESEEQENSSDEGKDNDDDDDESETHQANETRESNDESEEDNNSEDESDDDDSTANVKDHDEKYTYRPLPGQDLYGNIVDTNSADNEKPKKYIPPHLRNKQLQQPNDNQSNSQQKNDAKDDDPERKAKLMSLQRILNNNLNRLADNTLESVGKSISSIYSSNQYSIRDTNDCFWKNIKTACVVEHMVRTSLIPIYIACVSGVHFQSGDSVQLGGDIMERSVLALWGELAKYRESLSNDDSFVSKEASNYLLLLCYLYNYGVVHCTIIYDLVRHFIKYFTELDVELLLLILSHCGHQMRSDDPTALKDIVFLVQKRSVEMINDKKGSNNNDYNMVSSSRAQFIVTAITDLKNNKWKDKDTIIAEKTSNYRKVIGRMKSVVTTIGDGKSLSSNVLRVSIQDILDIETKGRWWKVGAKWAGHINNNAKGTQLDKDHNSNEKSTPQVDAKQKALLALAAKQRMNTDLRRSIFCIIMGSDDCQDAFENLVRNSMLKGKNEREVVRVIVHCCATEKVYNPYYAFLSNRISEYQSNCRFSFQLTFWDHFKQFESMKPRKAANLAKLLAYLLMNNRLNLNVLKIIDISPDEMPEAAIIFLTILFTNLFESIDDPDQITALFKRGDPSREYLEEKAREAMEEGNVLGTNDREELKANINIFLLHYLQESPKNKKKSTFRKNFKAAIKTCESDSFDLMF
jgi:nucleolar MIF4G domain-containing protein 1